jgi:hypothetical protein
VTVVANHIVVDASVARSASDPARHPVTAACLKLARQLERKGCQTGAVMTPALQAEWKRHASRMMTSWLVSMEQRGRVRRERDRVVRDLRNATKGIGDPGIRNAIEKDLHLSEAAIIHGVPVASLDDRQRTFLRGLASAYAAAGRIQWVNPVSDAGWEPWLEGGCVESQAFVVHQPAPPTPDD